MRQLKAGVYKVMDSFAVEGAAVLQVERLATGTLSRETIVAKDTRFTPPPLTHLVPLQGDGFYAILPGAEVATYIWDGDAYRDVSPEPGDPFPAARFVKLAHGTGAMVVAEHSPDGETWHQTDGRVIAVLDDPDGEVLSWGSSQPMSVTFGGVMRVVQERGARKVHLYGDELFLDSQDREEVSGSPANQALARVLAEREHQRAHWSEEHDRHHIPCDWALLIAQYVGKLAYHCLAQAGDQDHDAEREQLGEYHRRLAQVGALCLAALEREGQWRLLADLRTGHIGEAEDDGLGQDQPGATRPDLSGIEHVSRPPQEREIDALLHRINGLEGRIEVLQATVERDGTFMLDQCNHHNQEWTAISRRLGTAEASLGLHGTQLTQMEEKTRNLHAVYASLSQALKRATDQGEQDKLDVRLEALENPPAPGPAGEAPGEEPDDALVRISDLSWSTKTSSPWHVRLVDGPMLTIPNTPSTPQLRTGDLVQVRRDKAGAIIGLRWFGPDGGSPPLFLAGEEYAGDARDF